MHWGFRAAALAAMLGAGSALGQYELPISRPSPAREIDDPKPVYNYELQPQHGEFLVCVKSFQGEAAGGGARAKALAEGLAEYIRSECKLYAYVHETGWLMRQERKKEKEAVIAATRKYYESQGALVTDKMLEVKMARIPDEYIVFVAPGKGTLKTMDEAIAFAKFVHKLPAPPAEYCDPIVVGSIEDVSRRRGEPQNPFPRALPGRNRTLPKKDESGPQRPKADDFLMGLNAGQPYSLIHNTKKPFTLVVQTYGAKFGLGRVVKPGEVLDTKSKSDGELLERAAQQAHAVAEALRRMKYKAYVLHTRYESFVCIGEYDSEKDAELLANAKVFASLPLRDDKRGQIIETFMDKPMPAMIPRP